MPIATKKIGESISGPKVSIRFKGPFDYTYLARTVQRWFEQRRFKFMESRIKDAGKKMKVDMEATRDIDEFYAESYTVKMEMWELSSQEVIVNGEPRKILNGLVQIDVSGSVKTDRAGFFKKKGKLYEFLGKVLIDARWREIEAKYIDVMEYRTQDIQTAIKECLNMTTKENAPW